MHAVAPTPARATAITPRTGTDGERSVLDVAPVREDLEAPITLVFVDALIQV
jgi:hypothetical protein